MRDHQGRWRYSLSDPEASPTRTLHTSLSNSSRLDNDGLMNTTEPEGPWYSDGLRFECSRCGDCCRGPGHVWVSAREVDRLAEGVDMPIDTFARQYLRTVAGRLALIDNDDGDCVFWRDGCSVYLHRPAQCRTFPFWTQNLLRPEAWQKTVRQCPGAGEGRLYSLGEISRLRAGNGQTEPAGAPGEDPEPTPRAAS